MPRLIKYTTQGLLDDIPDQSLQIVEHAGLWYYVDSNFKGRNKYIAYALLGSLWEYGIFQLKQKDPDTKTSGKK